MKFDLTADGREKRSTIALPLHHNRIPLTNAKRKRNNDNRKSKKAKTQRTQSSDMQACRIGCALRTLRCRTQVEYLKKHSECLNVGVHVARHNIFWASNITRSRILHHEIPIVCANTFHLVTHQPIRAPPTHACMSPRQCVLSCCI